MLITFITGDGEFTTNMFKSINDAKDFLADDITDIMIQNLSEDHAIIVVPNARVAIFNDEQHVTKAPSDFAKIISNLYNDSIEQEIMKNEDVSITPMTPEEADDLPTEPDSEVPPATDEDVQQMIKEFDEYFGHFKINDKKENPEKKSNKQNTSQNNNDDNKDVED